jgi:hypothetical protein
MSFSMVSLLVHSAEVPPGAKSALRAASEASPSSRREHLASAARILYAEAGLDCADARELVGLPGDERGCV